VSSSPGAGVSAIPGSRLTHESADRMRAAADAYSGLRQMHRMVDSASQRTHAGRPANVACMSATCRSLCVH